MHIIPDFSDTIPDIPRQEKPKKMMSVRFEGSKAFVQINSSSLGIIQECPRKTQYSLIDDLILPNEPAATLFGKGIHKALEIYYGAKRSERTIPDLEIMELMSFGNFVPEEENVPTLRATRAFLSTAQALNSLPSDNMRSLQNGVWLLHNYFQTYLQKEADPFVTYEDEQGPFVERNFSFLLYDSSTLRIDYFGTIDLILKNEQTGELLVTDHKTSSRVGSDFYNRLKPNHQYTGYLLGAVIAFGLNTNSFLVNCLQVKKKPAKGKGPDFPRQITIRDENDYEEFKRSVIEAVKNYLNWLENGTTLGHVNACAQYGGCTFLDVCSAPQKLRENIIKAKYVRRSDTPIN